MNDIGWNDNEPYESRLHHAELNAAYEKGYTQGYQDAVETLGKNEQQTGEWIPVKTSTDLVFNAGGHLYGVMGGDKIMEEFEKDKKEADDDTGLNRSMY